MALVPLCDPQILKKKAERLRAALAGTRKEEHLFALHQASALWQGWQKKIAECDQALEAVLKELAGPEDPKHPAPSATQKVGVHAPQIAGLLGMLRRLFGGQDPTPLPGVADYVWLQLIAEMAIAEELVGTALCPRPRPASGSYRARGVAGPILVPRLPGAGTPPCPARHHCPLRSLSLTNCGPSYHKASFDAGQARRCNQPILWS